LAKRKSVLEAARDMIAVDLEQAQEVLRRTRIASPVNGTVITSHVEPGDYVRKGDPVAEISQSAPMEVRCNLRIEDLYWVWLAGGQVDAGSVSLSEKGDRHPSSNVRAERERDRTGARPPFRSESLAAAWEIPQLPVEVVYRFNGSEALWKGSLFRYEGTGLDEETRTVPCRVLVGEPLQATVSLAAGGKQLPSARLVSGMYVEIRIAIDPPQSLLALPQAAVRPGNQVWIARDGVLRIETVDVAKVGRDQVLVEAGATSLRPGDEVITSPLAAVKDGMPVRTAVQNSRDDQRLSSAI
jgi:multidrug efflux pump subunit AcrA (membrane-fusion protein)